MFKTPRKAGKEKQRNKKQKMNDKVVNFSDYMSIIILN